ncbi:hypothetical protein SFR_2089 [Streptomyces sp. FR-008]|nr:hypothetical protein SFR_2089 [Streptomyces sp. FR-008]
MPEGHFGVLSTCPQGDKSNTSRPHGVTVRLPRQRPLTSGTFVPFVQ